MDAAAQQQDQPAPEQPQPHQQEQHAQPQPEQQQEQQRQEPAGTAEGTPAPGVSDEQVIHAVRELLKTADLNTLTEKQTRKQVESKLGVDLSGRKEVIKNEIASWLAAQQGEDEGEGSEEEEEQEEQEEEKPKSGGRGAGKRKASSEGKKKGGGGGGGFNKLCVLSPALAAFLGKEKESRGQVVKGIWDYIKANGLQEPSNKRNIRCDDKMRTILKPPINMFNMNKQLSKHIYKDEGEPSSKNASEDAEEGGSEGEDEEDGEQEKQPPKKKAAKKDKESSGSGKGSVFTRPLQLSEQLSEFLGGQKEMSRPDLTRRFWDYFKENNLQNPSDKREILCNDQLKNLFGVDKFIGFGLMKHLKPHLS